MSEKFKVVEKTIDTSKSICGDIQEKIHKFRMRHRDAPKTILLGPNEYMRLCGEIERLYPYGGLSGIRYPDTFVGIPIRVKLTSGIDFEVPTDQAYRFAMGIEEEKYI